MAELPHIGQNCDVRLCNQLDFLPFTCDFCQGTFCLEHRVPDLHGCKQTDTSQPVVSSATVPSAVACKAEGCKNKELLPVVCDDCKLNFCIRHRFPSDHSCSSLRKLEPPQVPKPEIKKEVVRRPQGRKSDKTARQVQLMKMKMNAKGDGGIPQSERVYFLVHHGPPDSSQAFYFSKVWSVGKVVDTLAAYLKLQNNNNIVKAKKLRLFVMDTGAALTLSDSVDQVLTSGHAASGDSLIIKYVDDNVTHIDQLDSSGQS